MEALGSVLVLEVMNYLWLSLLCEISPYHNKRPASLKGGALNRRAESREPFWTGEGALKQGCYGDACQPGSQGEQVLGMRVRQGEWEIVCPCLFRARVWEKAEIGAAYVQAQEFTCCRHTRGEYSLLMGAHGSKHWGLNFNMVTVETCACALWGGATCLAAQGSAGLVEQWVCCAKGWCFWTCTWKQVVVHAGSMMKQTCWWWNRPVV